MKETKEDRLSVYEIGYLVSFAVPEDSVLSEADSIKKIITDAGASIISEGAPNREQLAYTIRTKNSSGSYENHESAYFGWVKFTLDSGSVEAVKTKIELKPMIIRSLLIKTVEENTYLGKRAPTLMTEPEIHTNPLVKVPGVGAIEDDKRDDVVPATIEDMDKSIDEMVKEA